MMMRGVYRYEEDLDCHLWTNTYVDGIGTTGTVMRHNEMDGRDSRVGYLQRKGRDEKYMALRGENRPPDAVVPAVPDDGIVRQTK